MAAKQKKRGRPRKGPAATKSASVLLRMEKREKEGFAGAAALAGAPLAVWMRSGCAAAARELEAAALPVAFLKNRKDG